ncbi:hypothetical protein HDK90DRAFT_475975 [Phyllosticta capitalensis]|uniref:Extracellular mutant protein 11 C-terminal domain-containing protein n=2 Tax=Phyllosticta capitalensis TaxID=121624 RepID=A0ABR1YYS8_9PEZI
MERQENEAEHEDFDQYLTGADWEEDDHLFPREEQTENAKADLGANLERSEAVEGPEKTQEEMMAINAGHEILPPVNAPPMKGFIDPALLERAAVANNSSVPALEQEEEQPETLEKDTIATNVVPALVQEERQAQTRTNQPDETSHEAVEKPTSDRIWEPSSSYGKKTPGKSSPPDPRKSVFAKNTASGNSSQPHPSSSVSADRRRENIDVANDEREIEQVQETRHDGMEIVADNEMGIEKVPQAHDENAERPPLDERTNRKPRIIEFDRTGPVNQGKTPRGSKVLPQSHSFGATQTKTASHRMDQMSNKRTPVRLPRQYGSGPQRTYQDHVSYGEMLSSPDRSNPPEKKKSLGHSQTIEGPAVESAVEKTRRKTPSEGTAELESEDELSRSPPTKTRASVSPNGRDLQGVEVPAIEPGISIQPGSKPPSESDYEDDLADGSTFCPPSDDETSPGINPPVMETEIENDAQKTLSESGAEWGFAHESTVVPLAEIEQSAPSKSGPSPRHLDGKPASEVVSSPAQATPSSFVPTPAATNRTKRRHEEGVDDFSNLLAKSVSFSGHGKAQPAPHSVGASKELDTPEDPYKRRKFDHQPSNTHRESLKALPLFKKTEATAPPVPHFKQPIPLQRKNSTRISEDGSPEPYNDPKRSVFNVAGSSETRPQSHLNRSPAMARARIAPSPSYSRNVLSSNKKKVPDPPLASSNAITEHASEDMLEQSKILNTPAPPEANPFTSPETLKNGESKFAARLRRKTEAQGVKSADGKQGSKTIGLEALVKARLEENDDPDKTLVNDDDMGDFPDDDSDMSNASTLDEDEDEDEDLHLKHRHPDEMDWEERLKPHQQNYASALSRVSQRLVRHLIDQETAIEDIVVAFQQDGNNLIDELERAHEEEFELERDTVIKAKTELQSMLERMSVKLRNDKQLYEARRQKLRQEAETSNRSSGLKKQIGVLEGMLKETK